VNVFLHDPIAVLMFVALGLLIFSGLPVALVLTGVGVGFGLLGYAMGLVRLADFGAIYHRVYGTLSDSEDIQWAAVPGLATWLPDQLLNLEATRGVKVRE
jgi:TRAP-type mannitol/chloroaromatic compound transport system permease large subunit